MSEIFIQINLSKKNPHLEKNPHQIGSLVYKARSSLINKIFFYIILFSKSGKWRKVNSVRICIIHVSIILFNHMLGIS